MILWGFLRDTHGGVEASKELCRYASRRGVRILPGVGTSGYAGYYYEGKNEFNADTWLARHPELRAVERNGDLPAASWNRGGGDPVARVVSGKRSREGEDEPNRSSGKVGFNQAKRDLRDGDSGNCRQHCCDERGDDAVASCDADASQRGLGDDFGHNIGGIAPAQRAFGAHDAAMRQSQRGEGLDVVREDKGAAIDGCARLGGAIERQRPTRGGT